MIKINLNKAKTIAHDIRRVERAREFEPLDNIIAKRLPQDLDKAEEARVAIREKYAIIQTNIDTVTSVDDLKKIVDEFRTS